MTVNALKFARAVCDLLHVQLGQDFGECLDEALSEVLESQDVTQLDLSEAFTSLLYAVFPAFDAARMGSACKMMSLPIAGPEQVCEVLVFLIGFRIPVKDPQATFDLKTILTDWPGAREKAALMVNQFFVSVSGETLLTYEERTAARKAAEEEKAREHAIYVATFERWGNFMCDAEDLLAAGKYLESFPRALRQDALNGAARYLYEALQLQLQREVEKIGDNPEQFFAALRKLAGEDLRRFCAENAYRAPAEG